MMRVFLTELSARYAEEALRYAFAKDTENHYIWLALWVDVRRELDALPMPPT